MTDQRDEQARWPTFVEAIASGAGVSVTAITPKTRIVDDLGLDSLALAELVVTLIVDFGMSSLSDRLDQERWDDVTVGELYEREQSGSAGPDRIVFHSSATRGVSSRS